MLGIWIELIFVFRLPGIIIMLTKTESRDHFMISRMNIWVSLFELRKDLNK